MKKLLALALTLVVSLTLSISVFAVSSPSGEGKDDKFNVSGQVTSAGKAFDGVKVEISGKSSETNEKGSYKIEGVKVGDYEAVFSKDAKELGKVKFKISVGNEAKFEKNTDGSYNVYLPANVVNYIINFDLDANGVFSITKVAVGGNDSSQSPVTSDILYTLVAIVTVSLMGACVTFFAKKRYSL